MEELKFLGIGGASNVELGSNSCFIKRGKALLLIDVGEGAAFKLLKNNYFNGVKEVDILITHTHFDHVAGLGVLTWYLNFVLNIKPNIIYDTQKYLKVIKKLLEFTGVELNLVNFIKDTEFKLDDLSLKMRVTPHAPGFICHGVTFKDKLGKYYYTGDTNEIDYIRKMNADKNIKTIYTEASEYTWNVHICYDDLLAIKSDKLVLMHIDSVKTYNRAIKDGFNIASRI